MNDAGRPLDAADDDGMNALGYFRVELPQNITADNAISC